MAVKCTSCHQDSDVIDSRPINTTIRRRRKCKHCKQRWTTREITDGELRELQRRSRVLDRIIKELDKVKRMCDVEVKIHHETDQAYLFSTDGNKDKAVWCPKRINGEEYEVDEGEKGYAVITVPEWWAAEKGLV